MNEPKVIACLGKGGVGKTAVAALTGRLLIEKGLRVLFVDADPAMGLSCALDASGYKTIGEARIEIIRQAKISSSAEEKARLGDMVDYLLLEALYDTGNYGLLVMGQTDSLGCYCPINSLLRSTIAAMASQYDWIIIDAEAGIEQVNRQVVESVDYPLIITDNTMRGVKTSIMIAGLIERIPQMQPQKTGIIFNRVEQAAGSLCQQLTDAGLESFGTVPADQNIGELDLKGRPILEIASDSPALQALQQILQNHEIL